LASGSGYPIWIIDGATNTISATTISAPQIPIAFAVDPGKKLYVWTFSSGATPQGVTVFDTTLAVPASVGTVPLGDLAEGSGRLALDTTNKLLFACGSTPYAATPSLAPAYDTIDTTTNAIKGTQKTFDPQKDGYFVDCKGGPGWADMVTNGTTSSPAVLHELEPLDIPLPGNFIPSSYTTISSGASADAARTVIVFGRDSGGTPQFITLSLHGEVLGYKPIPVSIAFANKVGWNPDIDLSIVSAITSNDDYDVYVTTSGLTDSHILHVH
jgi:hypothetical protein